jgi:5-methyltetrahydrofolate--homocysteine methyltransferase
MKKAFERLKAEMKRSKGPVTGRILMATVEGDIHDIGKNILIALLENHGFEVIDLGKSVPADRIVEGARKNKVDLVGLSALMTTTMTEMKRVIGKLKKAGIKTFVAVGGAVVNEEYAREIGLTSMQRMQWTLSARSPASYVSRISFSLIQSISLKHTPYRDS